MCTNPLIKCRDNVHAIEDFLMLETFTQVHVFCRLVGHYLHFIKGFVHMAKPLYDVLGKEVKIGLVQLPPEAWEAVWILKERFRLPWYWYSRILTDHFS